MLLLTGPATPAGLLRLPARGGAALFLEAHWGAAGWQDLHQTGLLVDVALLDPTRYVRYQSRPCSSDTLDRLGTYLLAAASELHPEQTLADFQDAALGLLLSAVTSDDFEVELEIQVAQDLDEELLEYDGLNVQTTRAVLVSAAQQVPSLSEPPQFLDAEV